MVRAASADCGAETGVDLERLAVARERVRAALAVAVPIDEPVEGLRELRMLS